MEMEQLTAIFQDCREMLRLVSNDIQRQAKGAKTAKNLSQLIRKRRIQIGQLHDEAKHEGLNKMSKQNGYKQQTSLVKQVRNAKSIYVKSQQQQRRITELYNSLSQKITELNSNITKKQNQLNFIIDQVNNLQLIQNRNLQYRIGFRKLQNCNQRAIQFQEQQQVLLHSKIVKINDIHNNIDQIDQKTQQLQMKIKLQNQIITSIRTKQLQIKQKYQSFVDQDEDFIFYREGPLDLWEINEVQQLAGRREQASLRERRQIGKIIKLKQRTQQSPIKTAQLNTQRNNSNGKAQIYARQLENIKSNRLRQLTQRKSLPSTRIYIKQPSQHKRISINQPNQPDSGYRIFHTPEKSKQEGTPFKNIQVFKLRRTQNKKRKKMGLKGLVFERDIMQ